MKIVLSQEEPEVLANIRVLCKAERVDLETVAKRMGTTYQKLYHKLGAKYVELELIEQVIEAIQLKKRGRKISLLNYSEITIASTTGLRLNLVSHE